MRGALAVPVLLAALTMPRAAAGESETYAVLTSDATLRTSTKKGAEAFQLGTVNHPGVGYEVEVLSTKGEFFKVRTAADARCQRNFDGLTDMALTMYVAKSDLHRVLTEALSLDLGDGQRVEARPGAIAADNALHAERFSVAVPVPESATGLTFRRDPAITGHQSNAEVAAHHWMVSDIAIESRGSASSFHDTAGGASIATMLSPCLTASVKLSTEESKLVSRSRNVTGGLFGAAVGERLVLAKGTRLSWAAGGAAGVVREPIALVEATAKKKRRCFVRTLTGETNRVTLCAAKRAFKKTNADKWGGLIGGIGRGAVAFGRTSVSAGLSRAKVQSLIRRKRGPILRCFRRSQRRGRQIVGTSRVEIVWRVVKKGRAKSVKVVGTNSTSSVARCIEGVSRTLRFPQPTTSIATIAQTIRFIP